MQGWWKRTNSRALQESVSRLSKMSVGATACPEPSEGDKWTEEGKGQCVWTEYMWTEGKGRSVWKLMGKVGLCG